MKIKFQLLTYLVLVGMIPVMVRPLTGYFDSLTISFCRMLAGLLALLVFAYFAYGDDLLPSLHPRHIPWQLMLYSVIQVVGYFAWTQGTADTNATLSALSILIPIPAVTITALIFYSDERKGRHMLFTVIGVVCTSFAAFAYAGMQFIMPEGEHWLRGVICLGIGALAGCYVPFLLKSTLHIMKPLAVSIHSSIIITVLLLLCACAFGHPENIFHSSSANLLLLFGSGAFGIVVGVLFYNYLIHSARLIPVMVTSIFSPIVTSFAAWMFLREVPTVSQFIWGSMMIAGCGLCMIPPRKFGHNDKNAAESVK